MNTQISLKPYGVDSKPAWVFLFCFFEWATLEEGRRINWLNGYGMTNKLLIFLFIYFEYEVLECRSQFNPHLPISTSKTFVKYTPQTRSQISIYVYFYRLTRSHSSWKVQSAMVPQVRLKVTSLPCTFNTLGLVTINGYR